jgi:hypothetical protein
MKAHLVTGALVVVGLINLAPVLGVISGARLQALYGLPLDNPDLVLMLRHRALLFGLLGAFILVAAFRPSLQPLAFGAAFISMAGFIVLGWPPGAHGAPMQKIFYADLLGLLLLAVGVSSYLLDRN